MTNNTPATEYTFATRHDAQEFANLKSMVDGKIVAGPFIAGDKWAVHVSDPS
ncbi:hypothetical protein [Microbacterium sp. XT11]|uniref:hypothetical protein n=1 Tax=Microbacterium sp. XT11 TaxID=367477 RepID=UPI000A8ABE6D|nr:hypothetical protein [Microbacterium sp. XT11]